MEQHELEELKARPAITTELVCDCDICKRGRLIHWYCDSCGEGPFKFSHADPGAAPTRTPYGQRQYNQAYTGLVGGIRRWCSATCATAEERTYLIELLDKAQARKDLTAVRVITGRLHELDNGVAPQIPIRTERETRRGPDPSVERAPSLVDVDGTPLTE